MFKDKQADEQVTEAMDWDQFRIDIIGLESSAVEVLLECYNITPEDKAKGMRIFYGLEDGEDAIPPEPIARQHAMDMDAFSDEAEPEEPEVTTKRMSPTGAASEPSVPQDSLEDLLAKTLYEAPHPTKEMFYNIEKMIRGKVRPNASGIEDNGKWVSAVQILAEKIEITKAALTFSQSGEEMLHNMIALMGWINLAHLLSVYPMECHGPQLPAEKTFPDLSEQERKQYEAQSHAALPYCAKVTSEQNTVIAEAKELVTLKAICAFQTVEAFPAELLPFVEESVDALLTQKAKKTIAPEADAVLNGVLEFAGKRIKSFKGQAFGPKESLCLKIIRLSSDDQEYDHFCLSALSSVSKDEISVKQLSDLMKKDKTGERGRALIGKMYPVIMGVPVGDVVQLQNLTRLLHEALGDNQSSTHPLEITLLNRWVKELKGLHEEVTIEPPKPKLLEKMQVAEQSFLKSIERLGDSRALPYLQHYFQFSHFLCSEALDEAITSTEVPTYDAQYIFLLMNRLLQDSRRSLDNGALAVLKNLLSKEEALPLEDDLSKIFQVLLEARNRWPLVSAILENILDPADLPPRLPANFLDLIVQHKGLPPVIALFYSPAILEMLINKGESVATYEDAIGLQKAFALWLASEDFSRVDSDLIPLLGPCVVEPIKEMCQDSVASISQAICTKIDNLNLVLSAYRAPKSLVTRLFELPEDLDDFVNKHVAVLKNICKERACLKIMIQSISQIPGLLSDEVRGNVEAVLATPLLSEDNFRAGLKQALKEKRKQEGAKTMFQATKAGACVLTHYQASSLEVRRMQRAQRAAEEQGGCAYLPGAASRQVNS